MYNKLNAYPKIKISNPFMAFTGKIFICQIMFLIISIVNLATKGNMNFLPSILLVQINAVTFFVSFLIIPFYFRIVRGYDIGKTFSIILPLYQEKKYKEFLENSENIDLKIILSFICSMMIVALVTSCSLFIKNTITSPLRTAEIVIFILSTLYVVPLNIFITKGFINLINKTKNADQKIINMETISND